TAAADGDAVAVQVHGGAAVGRQHLEAVADLHGVVWRVDGGVLLRQLLDGILRPALDLRPAEVLGDGLAAGVEDVAARPSADDGAQDRERAGDLRTACVVGRVHEQERAGLDLGYPLRLADDLAGAGAGPGDHADGNAVLLQQAARADQLLGRLQAALALLG